METSLSFDLWLHDFRIYRCDSTSGSCKPTFPGTPYKIVSDPNARSFADTQVQQGHTYCYFVTFTYQDFYNPQDIYESSSQAQPSCAAPSSACPASILITGHSYNGPIQTFDFTDGALVNSFPPDFMSSGRGLAIYQGFIYYTDLGDPNTIHACPYGTEASGGSDDPSKTIQNTWRPNIAIQDLAFHGGYLYALSGYPDASHRLGYTLEVQKIDPATKTAIGAPVSISDPNDPNLPKTPTSDADGFTVLPNGNFLINDGDGANGATIFREYSASTGQVIDPPAGFKIDLSDYGFDDCSGVTIAPDGSLYFATGTRASQGILVHAVVNWSNDQVTSVASQAISDNTTEDVDVIIP